MVVGGVAGTAAVVGFILAIAGVIGWGLPFIAVAVAVVCALLFRGIVSPRR